MGKIIEKDLRELLSFSLAGQRAGDGLQSIEGKHLVPALLSQYRDLSRLRYDFPLVLLEKRGATSFVSLTGLINGVLQNIAPSGIEGEAMRKQTLGVEKHIRILVSQGNSDTLHALWDKAAKKAIRQVGGNADAKKTMTTRLNLVRASLPGDGRLIDCDASTAELVLTHAWHAIHDERHAELLNVIRDLAIKLKDILDADFRKTADAFKPKALRESVGKAYSDEIDFTAMSKILRTKTHPKTMPVSRRSRIESIHKTLISQTLITSTPLPKRNPKRHPFIVARCSQALKAYQERQEELVALVRAMRIAKLEIDNRYQQEKHDAYFEAFNLDALTTEERDFLPTILVCQQAKEDKPSDQAALLHILSSDLPIKVLVQSDDVLPNGAHASGVPSPDGWVTQLARMAAGLDSAFVLQTTTSHLHQVAQNIEDGLRFSGPALFSVFHGNSSHCPDLSDYLVSAATLQARLFPIFQANPNHGSDLADRFSSKANPQVTSTWPQDPFSYQDQDFQGATESLAFTPVDFMACDVRHQDEFALVPQDRWHANMVPAADLIQSKTNGADKIPFIWMVDKDNRLYRVVTTQKVIGIARKFGAAWRSLQELLGIDNSYAIRLLEREKQAWEEEKQREIDDLKQTQQTETPAVPATPEAPPAEAVVSKEAEAPSDEAWIETARCTSCNECTDKNNQMFKYNENKQAYIADVKAGTFKELVEAAEKCPVCIIHPGKPWNEDEPGLEDLIKRAESFQ